ncbi:hypothetical protein IVG45_16100 [Methylomonas sp. LL1]|uniref:hypothetical protein n=1 Tax=Methylomonas sp. LL1 TaxID=2785785 RepID=UPI0018C3B49D|nr:hypothetical protein [Methylomonas sp. LL1]QPK62364.1 hypothetical protein IVG45_16100 [Methylomonas sp. LL1]
MIKIKTFDIALTLAAFAALVFLLPPDKEISKVSETKSQVSSSMSSITTKAHQQQRHVRGNFLHSA